MYICQFLSPSIIFVLFITHIFTLLPPSTIDIHHTLSLPIPIVLTSILPFSYYSFFPIISYSFFFYSAAVATTTMLLHPTVYLFFNGLYHPTTVFCIINFLLSPTCSSLSSLSLFYPHTCSCCLECTATKCHDQMHLVVGEWMETLLGREDLQG